MENAPVIIPATEQQKNDFQDIWFGNKTPKQEFVKKLSKIQQEYTETHKPFCYVCAKQDYEDAVQTFSEERKRNPNTTVLREQAEKIKIDAFLSTVKQQYGKESSFVLLNTKPVQEVVTINGTKENTLSAVRHDYICKKRNHGLTVDMPWYAWRDQHGSEEAARKAALLPTREKK